MTIQPTATNNSDNLRSSYHYDLPAEQIAAFPANPRDSSRLLVLTDQNIDSAIWDCHFSDLPKFLRSGDILVRNNTQVLPARLKGTKSTGGQVELLLCQPTVFVDDSDKSLEVKQNTGVTSYATAAVWTCLARPARSIRPGMIIDLADGKMQAKIQANLGQGMVTAELIYPDFASLPQALADCGEMPLPPYITRESGALPDDNSTYQTTYATIPGAVAAPTAGLHFTPELDNKLIDLGVKIVNVTLHVGIGTFRPVTADKLTEHKMHSEFFELSQTTTDIINKGRQSGNRIIAVGTTAVRVLESCADSNGHVSPQNGWTDIFIHPGYNFKVIQGMITNFHLPESTLLMLISSWLGRVNTIQLYEEAIYRKFRFYSYGDAMLLLK